MDNWYSFKVVQIIYNIIIIMIIIIIITIIMKATKTKLF